MTECVSYFKAVLPERLIVHCGGLCEEEIRWWKKLYFNGLGEFLYRNGIEAAEDELIQIEAAAPQGFAAPFMPQWRFDALTPVGGGKDSAVTATLLRNAGKTVRYFTVNDQKARTDTVLAAGGSEEQMVRTHRTIDPALLALNRQGFLNGHTPFSAIVAFLSAYCALLIGAGDIVLSNESSANEANIEGLTVNHQYSKSYEFERDFSDYLAKYAGVPIRYFSLLRPFNELQIAKMFAVIQLTWAGTPCLYQGQELGLVDHSMLPWGYDPDSDLYAISVASQEDDATSILNFYRQLINLRKSSLILQDGLIQMVQDDKAILSYLRSYGDQGILVVVNLSRRPVRAQTPLVGKLLVSSYVGRTDLTDRTLAPFEAIAMMV